MFVLIRVGCGVSDHSCNNKLGEIFFQISQLYMIFSFVGDIKHTHSTQQTSGNKLETPRNAPLGIDACRSLNSPSFSISSWFGERRGSSSPMKSAVYLL